MSSPPLPKKRPPLTVSVRDLTVRSLRDDAAAARLLASRLLGAELAGDWAAVKAVRAELVETALVLEGVASVDDV